MVRDPLDGFFIKECLAEKPRLFPILPFAHSSLRFQGIWEVRFSLFLGVENSCLLYKNCTVRKHSSCNVVFLLYLFNTILAISHPSVVIKVYLLPV